MAETEQLPTPLELERDLKNVTKAADRIQKTFDIIKIFLKAVQHQQNIRKISRIIENPFDDELVYRSLIELYGSIYALYQKIKEKTGSKVQFAEAKIGDRMAKEIMDEAIDRIVFLYERDVLLAPIRTDLSSKKGELGPAMYSEKVKRSGRNLISSIESQTNELLPTASQICQNFKGVAGTVVGKDDRKKHEREKYEDVWLIYQAEEIVKDRIKEIGAFQKEKQTLLGKLIDDFVALAVACQEKIDSLKFLQEKSQETLQKSFGEEQTTEHLDLQAEIKGAKEKAAKIGVAYVKLREIQKMLITLKNLIEKFPGIADNIEFYIESNYQAKSVQHFLDEITDEMKSVFGKRNIEAFEIISTLEYKLKANSLLYDAAGYYQAASYMEKDMTDHMTRFFQEKQQKEIAQKVTDALDKYGMTAMIKQLHSCVNRIKKKNNRMHMTLLRYGKKLAAYNEKTSPQNREQNKAELINNLKSLLHSIDSEVQQSVVPNYQHCQEIYQGFSEETIEDKHVGEQVIRCFFELTRQQKPIGMKKEELQNFQKFKLYSKMKPHSGMQSYFVKALKEFVKGEDSSDILPDNIAKRFDFEMEGLNRKLSEKYKDNIPLSTGEIAVKLIAESITAKEIESFARVVPSVPRNELRLVNLPGKAFVDIAARHSDFIRAQAQRQFVLLNAGEEPQSENEIMFKDLSAMELIKKAYGVLNNYMEPLFKQIDEEATKERDFVGREGSKWQKELEQVIFELQEQIGFAVEKSQPAGTDIRAYTAEEVKFMKRHIHPDQIDKLDELFSNEYEVDITSQLFELEDLVVDVVQGFYKLMEADEILRKEFEEIQSEKKKLHLGGNTEHLEEKIKRVESLRWQKRIEDLLKHWEFGINKALPTSDKKPKKEVKLRSFDQADLQTMAVNIDPGQLNRIKQNISIIRHHAQGKQEQILFNRGAAPLTVAQCSFDLLSKDEGLLIPAEKEGRQRIEMFERDDSFRDDVDEILAKSAPGGAAAAPRRPTSKKSPDKPSSDMAPMQLNKLISALRSRLTGKALSEALPKVTVKNLQTYALALTAGQFQNVAWLVKDRIKLPDIYPEERVLVIVSRNCLQLAKQNKTPHADDIMEMEVEIRLVQQRYQTIVAQKK